MAKFVSGPIAGQISGRLGSTIFSHNRGGPYMRNGTIPTKVTSDYAVNAKARLAAMSQAWAALTDDQRNAWSVYAASNPVLDRLGHQITLSGHQTYNGINARLNLWSQTLLDVPPIAEPPDPLSSLVADADIGAGDVDLTFTPSPAGATTALEVWAVIVNSAGISYVENLYKYLGVTAVDVASPLDIESILTARWGTLQVGQILHVRARLVTLANGLVSGWRQDTVAVTTS